jgi:cytidylate kinase
MREFIITIDGPAGSGKTTVAKALAKKLNLDLLESGAFYRYLTLRLLQSDIMDSQFSSDEIFRKKIEEFLSEIEIKISPEGTVLIYQGRPINNELRSKEVEEKVSEISSHPVVREEVNKFMRRLIEGKRVITEGRDMGSCVFPQADLKFFLTADLEERARRRAKDVIDRGLEEVIKNLLERDKMDSEREIAPLKVPESAIVIDTTNLKFDQVVERLEMFIERAYER